MLAAEALRRCRCGAVQLVVPGNGCPVVQDAAVDEVEVELWWAGLPGDVRDGLLDVGTEPIPEWYLANIPRGWLATIDAAFDATTGAPPITLEMLDPALRDFLARKAVEPLS